ncbi:MAG: hypothetical protein IPJ50_15425 [Betaproteobacteria bacterium]|nr:hypothetical protein [Betaproteobacteria bacterium]
MSADMQFTLTERFDGGSVHTGFPVGWPINKNKPALMAASFSLQAWHLGQVGLASGTNGISPELSDGRCSRITFPFVPRLPRQGPPVRVFGAFSLALWPAQSSSAIKRQHPLRNRTS